MKPIDKAIKVAQATVRHQQRRFHLEHHVDVFCTRIDVLEGQLERHGEGGEVGAGLQW